MKLATIILAAAASSPVDVPVQPYFDLQPGQAVRCMAPEGCVVMTADVFHALQLQAHQVGAASCRRRPSL